MTRALPPSKLIEPGLVPSLTTPLKKTAVEVLPMLPVPSVIWLLPVSVIGPVKKVRLELVLLKVILLLLKLIGLAMAKLVPTLLLSVAGSQGHGASLLRAALMLPSWTVAKADVGPRAGRDIAGRHSH